MYHGATSCYPHTAVWCIILHGLSKYLIVVKPANEKYLDLVTESNPELLAPCNQTIL